MVIMTENEAYIRKGDIYYVFLGKEQNGHIQSGGKTGFRPCIIVNNKIACAYSPVLLVVPITTSVARKHSKMPTHLFLEDPLPRKSVATFEQILTVNRGQLGHKIGTLSEEFMQKANEKLKIAFGLSQQFA